MEWKKKVAAGVFLCFLILVPVTAFLLPDQKTSKTERRQLAQKPEFSVKSFSDGTYMEQLETYFLEQFPARDVFRTIKSETETNVLGKADADGYFKVEDGVYHLEAELNEKNVNRVAKAIEKLCEEQFAESDCYVAVIPDKNYYLSEYKDDFAQDVGKQTETSQKKKEREYPVLDYDRLDEIMQEQIDSAEFISLYDQLELSDYYRTDLHWKQERLTDVVNTLMQSMGQENMALSGEWQTATDQFLGAYSAASAFLTKPDTIYYREKDLTDQMQVYDYEKQQTVSVYAPEKIGGMDDYDFYLWGARALITIQNPQCQNGKKLLLFRDSFGSSIAPLLAENYEEVTLVDLRYVSASYALELLEDTKYQHVLFLYSVPILNHGDSLRLG